MTSFEEGIEGAFWVAEKKSKTFLVDPKKLVEKI